MRENIVFDYLLANAWGLPLCRVSVSEDGFVQCQENRENTQGLQLEKAEVDKIKSIVSEHTHILDYDSKELESPDVFDGVMNFFDFEASDGRKVNLMAFNIGEVKTLFKRSPGERRTGRNRRSGKSNGGSKDIRGNRCYSGGEWSGCQMLKANICLKNA